MPPHPAPRGLVLAPPAPGSRPGPVTRTAPSTFAPLHGQHGQRKQKLRRERKGTLGWGEACSSPPPPLERGDWMGQKGQRQRETRRAGSGSLREKREEPQTLRSRDPERESVLRRGERHMKCRLQVGKLSEGEISARKDLVEREAEMPGGGGPGVGSQAPTPGPRHQPGPGTFTSLAGPLPACEDHLRVAASAASPL